MSPHERLAHRLALAIGERNPRAMLEAMPGSVWASWCRYWAVEPWGEERADHRAAMIAHVCHAGLGLKPRRRHNDFLIVRPEPARGQRSIDQVFAQLKAGGHLRRMEQ